MGEMSKRTPRCTPLHQRCDPVGERSLSADRETPHEPGCQFLSRQPSGLSPLNPSPYTEASRGQRDHLRPPRPGSCTMNQRGSTVLEGPVCEGGCWQDEAGAQFPRLYQEPEIRHDLVARVRAEIAAGDYDTPDRLEIALARMVHALDLD